MNKLLCGDAIEEMSKMEDDSIDLCFFSPPYEDCRTYDIGFNLKGQEYVGWLVTVFEQAVRITKGLTACVIQGRTRKFKWSCTPALLMADLHRAGFNVRNPPIYNRSGIPGSGGPDWLRSDYEWIVCTSKPGRLIWSANTICGESPKWAPGGAMSHRLKNGQRINQWGGSIKKTKGQRKKDGTFGSPKRPSHQFVEIGNLPIGYTPPVKANPGNIIHCNAGKGHMGSNLAHENEAPFPLKLAEFFVKSFCPPDGTVLDPFCGSSTTGHACVKNGRNYIGIDCRQSQIKLSRKRLVQAKKEIK